MDRRNFLSSAATTAGVVLGAAPAYGATASAPPQPPNFGTTGRDFPKVGGNLGNQNHTPLGQVNRRTIGRLGGAWHLNLEDGDTSSAQQSTIVAQDGVLYVQTTQQNVFAVDGRTGAVRWKTNLGTEKTNMRGVALGEGKVFSTSGANIVYALDQKTGAVVWKRQLMTEDPSQGTPEPCDPANGQCGGSTGTLAGAVVYWDGLIYVGMEGSTAGARGRAYALKAATGELAWTFWSVPGPGQFGNQTWEGDSWKTGGAVPWIHPAIDPDLGLVYWTFGNPYPRTNGSTRGGDNLFANSLVALDAKTGQRQWHFQSVHHDIWDYDNVMAPVLIDLRDRRQDPQGRRVRQQGRDVLHPRPRGRKTRTGNSGTAGTAGAAAENLADPAHSAGRPVRAAGPRLTGSMRPVPFYPFGGDLRRTLGPRHDDLPRRRRRRRLGARLVQPQHRLGATSATG